MSGRTEVTAIASEPKSPSLLFLTRFLRSPLTIGAIAPSSAVLARAMLTGLDLRMPGVRVVELGAGTGAFTREILARLAPDGHLVAIERDPVLVDAMRMRWPHLTCVCDSAERLAAIATEHGGRPIHHIVSGLPFASLPRSTSLAVMNAIAATLAAGGTFTTFQYVHASGLPPAMTFRREMSARLGDMRREALVFRNLPPAFVLRWWKAGC